MIEKIADDCRAIAAVIAPEIQEKPLYLLPRRFDGLIANAQCLGFSFALQDHRVRDHLIGAGQWEGPGRMVLVDSDAIAADAEETGRDFEHQFRQTFVHELAHALAVAVEQGDSEPTPQERIAQQERTEEAASRAIDFDAGQPWWAGGHGLKFTRRCLHLRHRALAAGWYLPLPGLCAGIGYGLSHPCHYDDAIADEPIRLRDATFSEIDSTAPPTAFIDLFETNNLWSNGPCRQQ